MAIKTFENSALVIKYDAGMVNGKVKVISKSYGSLDQNANADDVFAVAQAISDLQDHTLQDVFVKSTHSISL